MKLLAYIEKEGLKKTYFAKKIGVTRPTLYRYTSGRGRPLLSIATLIVRVTNGEVTLKDLGHDKT